MKRTIILPLLTIFCLNSTVFAWAPNAHGKTASKMLNHWTISPFLGQYGLNAGTIADMAWEADSSPWESTYEHPQWEEMRDRLYIFDNKWANLDETRRLSILCHVAADCGVPAGHSPANEVLGSGWKENELEARVETWGSFPDISLYTGTYAQKVATFHDRDLIPQANRLNGHSCWRDYFPVWSCDTQKDIGWKGLIYGESLGQAMLLDYFLAKVPVVAEANGGYAVNPGGSVALSASGSYDPDSVTTNSDGSYYQNWQGISSYQWDVNNDGSWDITGSSPTLSYDQLYSMVGPTEGRTIRLRVVDDEGSTYLNSGEGYDTATIAVYTPPTAVANGGYGVNPGGNVGFSASGSYDPDGGSITACQWDLDNNGTFETTGASPGLTYDQLYSMVGPTEGRTIRLQVTDNEGVTSTANSTLAVYTPPTAVANGGYGVNPGGNVGFSASGSYDPDGGSITACQWDLDNNGTFETAGASPGLTYDQLYSLVGPTEGRTIQLQVTDNEGVTSTATSTVAVYTPPTAVGRAQYGWMGDPNDVPDEWDWDNLIDNGSGDLDGGSIVTYEWNLDNAGGYDVSGGSSQRIYYSQFAALGVAPNENHTVTLRVTDNEGVTSEQTGIRMPILAKPLAEAGGNYGARCNGQVTLSASGSDPDGGDITSWSWDLDGDGQYDDATGQILSFSYDQLLALGLTPGIRNPIALKIVDNDKQITTWWEGEGYDTAWLGLYPSVDGDANADQAVNFSDYLTLSTNFGQTGTTWYQADFNLDGQVDFADYLLLSSNYGYNGATAAVPEPATLGLLLLGGVMGRALRNKKWCLR